MKKGVNFVLIVSFVLIILFTSSLSVVSANVFSDFFNNLFSGQNGEVMLSPHQCNPDINDKDSKGNYNGTNPECLNLQKNRYYQEGSYCVEESRDDGFCGCEEVNGKILGCRGGWDCVDNQCVKNTNDNNEEDEINCEEKCVELGECLNGKQTYQCEYLGDCNLDKGAWTEERTCESNTPLECNPPCSGERICIGGRCKLCSKNSDCPNGMVCLNEDTPQAMCRPMSSFIECNSELKCEKANQECINGICQNICKEECKQGYFCNDRGKCVKEKSCRLKSMECEDSTKILTDYKIKCKTSNFKYKWTIMYCPEGQICLDNKCVPTLEDNVVCTKGADGKGECQVESDGCPKGYKLNGDVCCAPGEELGNKFGIYYCIPTKVSCPQPPNKLCESSVQNACCPGDSGCSKTGIPYFTSYCNNDKKCEMDKNFKLVDCTNEKNKIDGKFCCKKSEVCMIKAGIKFCQPIDSNSCEENEEYCPGKGKSSLRTKCCPKGTCYNMPNGYPSCLIKN